MVGYAEITAFGRESQKDLWELEVSLVYTASSEPARDTGLPMLALTQTTFKHHACS